MKIYNIFIFMNHHIITYDDSLGYLFQLLFNAGRKCRKKPFGTVFAGRLAWVIRQQAYTELSVCIQTENSNGKGTFLALKVYRNIKYFLVSLESNLLDYFHAFYAI